MWHSLSTSAWSPCRARVLMMLVNAEKALAPWGFLEHWDTFRAITAGRSARSAVHLWLAKGGITPEQQPPSLPLVSFHHRLKEFLPAIGTMHVSGS